MIESERSIMFWEILGIKPTNNTKLIKKTYASLLSKYHPEEFPEEFQRLHWAYQEAIKYAKDGSSSQAPFLESTTAFVINSTVACDKKISFKSKFTKDTDMVSNDITFSELHNQFLSDSISSKTIYVQNLSNYVINDIINVGLDHYLQSPLNDFVTDTFYEFGDNAEFLLQLVKYIETNQVSHVSFSLLQLQYNTLLSMSDEKQSILKFLKFLKHQSVFTEARTQKRQKYFLYVIFCTFIFIIIMLLSISQSPNYRYRNAPSIEDVCQYATDTYGLQLVDNELYRDELESKAFDNGHAINAIEYYGYFLLDNTKQALSIIWAEDYGGNFSLSSNYNTVVLNYYTEKYGLQKKDRSLALPTFPPADKNVSDFVFHCYLEDTPLFTEQFGKFLNDYFSGNVSLQPEQEYTFYIHLESKAQPYLNTAPLEDFIFSVTAQSDMELPQKYFISSFETYVKEFELQENKSEAYFK